MDRYINVGKLFGFMNNAQIPYNKAIQDAIDAQPTEDVRKNIKGKWELDDVYHVCSNCGIPFYIPWFDEELWNYCPNCGADMRGDKT